MADASDKKDRTAVMAERERKKLEKKMKKLKVQPNDSQTANVPTNTATVPVIKTNEPLNKITNQPAENVKKPVQNKPIKAKNENNQQQEKSVQKEPVKIEALKLVEKPAVKKESEKVVKKEGDAVKSKPTHAKMPPLFHDLKANQKHAFQGNLKDIHPSVLSLAVQFKTGAIRGSNARCVAMLNAFTRVINDFRHTHDYARALESILDQSFSYLNSFRPASVSMRNAMRFLKHQLKLLATTDVKVEANAREQLKDVIETFIREQIDIAARAVSIETQLKVVDGDTLMVYGYSSLVYRILVDSQRSGKRFHVVVVDSVPLREGSDMLRKLVDENIPCTYVYLPSINLVMRKTTKVLLGAYSLLANGNVMALAGTAQIALAAKVWNIPVLVCCETYKFNEHVQTDSFGHNEIGHFALNGRDVNEETSEWLSTLRLTYDVTPSEFVTSIVTEITILGCNNVPLIIRKQADKLKVQ